MISNIASRYIGGVPYGPGQSVGRYPNAASVGAMPGVVGFPSVAPPAAVQQTGGVVPQSVGGVGGGGGGSGGAGGNMLAALLLGALGAAPDIYRAGRDLLGGEQYYGPGEDVFEPGSTFLGPGGVQIPSAALGGIGSDWTQVFEPGTMTEVPGGAARILDGAPSAGEGIVPGDGGALVPAEGAGALAGGSWNPLAGQGYDFGLTGSLGELPGFGDVATGAADLAGGMAGYYGSQTAVNSRNPNSGYGHQIGSTLGGIAGSFIPVPFIGTAVGSMMGGALGAEIGDSVGAPPTIGRNFSSIGTLGGDGQVYWGNSGGDNGGSAADADPFANWFSQNLAQQAQQQGLQFNPNMAGAQFRVGGYDNFDRGGPTAGGFFYTPDASGGSPENYALRPSDDWNTGAFSPDQGNAFTRSVLADMTARGAFTQAGQQGPGMDYWQTSQGAPLGWYGSEGGDYSRIAYGGGNFGSILGDRQNAITGWVNQQQALAQAQAQAQTQLDQSNRYAGQNTSGFDPITMLNAQNDPYMASAMGLQGVQMTENGPVFDTPGAAQVPAGWYQDGGA